MQQKRVLYVDPMCYKAHAYYNRLNIKLLCNICKLDVLLIDKYLDLKGININKSLIYKTPLKYFSEYNKTKIYFLRRITQKLGMFKIMREIKRVVKRGNYDMAIFSCCDIVAFAISTKHLKQKMAVVQHGLYRTTESKLVMHYLKRINQNITICVFEDYIKNYLVNDLKIKNSVKVVRHPIVIKNIEDINTRAESKKIKIFAPSFSNSKVIMDGLIENGDKFNDNIEIYFKGTGKSKSGNIKLFSGFIPREEYIRNFTDASYILIPYDKDFNYRLSGVVFEAIAQKKRIILFGGNTLEFYVHCYPHIFKIVNSVDDMIVWLNGLTKEAIANEYNADFYKDVQKFMTDYSDKTILNDFKKLLESVLE